MSDVFRFNIFRDIKKNILANSYFKYKIKEGSFK